MIWISVKDRLPQQEEWVLVYEQKDDTDYYGPFSIGVYKKFIIKNLTTGKSKEGMEWENNDCRELNPTHWMPLPPKPTTKPTIEPEDWED